MSFENSGVLITGGSKGIGLSIARVFARRTNRPIILIARNQEELLTAKEICLKEGAKEVDTLALDLLDQEAIDSLEVDKLNVGILVNNAGSFLFKSLSRTNQDEFIKQFQINTLGAFNLTQRILPRLKEMDRGLIVNICSQASLKGYGDSGAYTMSKHALLGYTRSLRKELVDTDIAVSAINLGQTFSTSWDGVDIDPQKLIDPEDVGRLIVSLSELTPRSVAEEIILSPQGGEVKPM
ncbi:MAG: SDR family oxidoreductase [Balneola sp.]|nr:MAG: SDR family oxidoreductase [Balneola sp.]